MVAARRKRWKALNEFVKEIASAMKESKTKPYDTVAKVLRVDEKTKHMSTLTAEQMKPRAADGY